MLKFTKHSRSSSVDRPISSIKLCHSSPIAARPRRGASVERAPKAITSTPPPPLPSRPSRPQKPQMPLTPSVQRLSAGTSETVPQKSALKKRYDFHTAVEKLVQEKYNSLDTSSESGYGSDQDREPRGAGSLVPPLPPKPSPSLQKKKQVKFDSYVMLLQGLRDRDLEVIRTHLHLVSDAALLTEEVRSAFVAAIVECREDMVSALLARGFDANASADAAGLTGLHLAAALNYLPIVRLLLTHGACVLALAHSSGKTAADLCSANLPNYQACHAYLRCMEECLGVANQGRVYACHNYHTARSDELELSKGQQLSVLRKGDYPGSSWWWCQDSLGHQGYVLREILSLNSPAL